jgi:hypothetical protein
MSAKMFAFAFVIGTVWAFNAFVLSPMGYNLWAIVGSMVK